MELIAQDDQRQLLIKAEDTPSDATVDLISQTIWGSGGTRYQICDARQKLRLLHGSRFISLEVGGQLVGVYVLRGKTVRIGEADLPAYYRTFLAIDSANVGQGYGRLLVQKTRDYYSRKLGGHGVLYGYIEADNESSLRVSRHGGYESIGGFGTTVFNRLFPRDDRRVRPLAEGEREELVALLNEQYAGHVLQDFEQSVDVSSYYVLVEDGTIRAGVHIEPCHWRVLGLPGVRGRLLVEVISRMPGVRRLFDAQNCRFLKLGNLYLRQDEESAVFSLVEALLARSGMTLAMAFQDPRSPVSQRMRSHGRFGILNSGVAAQVHVMAALEGFTDEQRAQCRQSPLCISPLDIG